MNEVEFFSNAEMIQVESPNVYTEPNCVEEIQTDIDWSLEQNTSPEISEQGILSPDLCGAILALTDRILEEK